MLHDDCLGRTLDWLYEHDPTALFAGLARQARQRFGIAARQVHVDTTSFAVTGECAADLDAQTLAVTYGYSRDHRADLKQWMLALATTRQGDVPLYCQALDGIASDKVSLVAVLEALAEQLRTDEQDDEEAPIFVADSGLYSAENVAHLSGAGVRWIRRVPDTSTPAKQAKAALAVADAAWQQEGDLFWASAPQAPAGEAGSWSAPSGARSGSARRSSGRWRRRAPCGRSSSGISGPSASPAHPTRKRRWTSSSSSVRSGSGCRLTSCPIPSSTDQGVPARARRPTAPTGRSKQR
jgi:hypothetical protein